MQISESDWKLFRSRLPEWQERHMESLVHEYAIMLAGPGSASEKFWALEKRMKEDRRHVGVVAEMSRSSMYGNLLSLFHEGTITLDDLDGFSDALRERFSFVVQKTEHEDIP